MRASIAAAVFILRGGKPPPKKVECLLRLPSIFRKEKSPMKKGGKGSSPPCPRTISPAPSSPHLPNKDLANPDFFRADFLTFCEKSGSGGRPTDPDFFAI
jgi:hypothetical protein